MMPQIGPMEIVLVAIIALVFLGPKRLPEAGKALGNGIRELKGSLNGEDQRVETREVEPSEHKPA